MKPKNPNCDSVRAALYIKELLEKDSKISVDECVAICKDKFKLANSTLKGIYTREKAALKENNVLKDIEKLFAAKEKKQEEIRKKYSENYHNGKQRMKFKFDDSKLFG